MEKIYKDTKEYLLEIIEQDAVTYASTPLWCVFVVPKWVDYIKWMYDFVEQQFKFSENDIINVLKLSEDEAIEIKKLAKIKSLKIQIKELEESITK